MNSKEILQPHSVLYAEDNQQIQKQVAEFLGRYFHQVHLADDGKEALALYHSMQPSVLILDIDMPYIDGLEVAKTVRELDEQIPIVMLTAFTDTPRLLAATELRLSKYLVKPVTPTAFKEVMEKLASHYETISEDMIQLKDDYTWDTKAMRLYHSNTAISLTQKEMRLLYLLISHRERCLTFIDIQTQVWEDGYEQDVSTESVKSQVAQLRKKLPKNSIKSVYGQGYMLL